MSDSKVIDNLYLECNPDILIIKRESDVLDLFENLFPHRKLLIYQNNLSPDFFDLSTGLAGAVLQKLVNYQIKTAFVVDIEGIRSEKFKEMVYEANMKDEYRFFDSKDQAVEWLLKD